MFKYLNNNKGVALLLVLAVMTVLVAIGGTMLYMMSSESKIVYDYGNNTRAFYVAEAGVDFAIKEWEQYIDSLKVANEQTNDPMDKMIPENISVDIGGFINQIQTRKVALEGNLSESYKLNDSNNLLTIKFQSNQHGLLKRTVKGSEPSTLKIKVIGSYDGDDFEYQYDVQLWYYWDGSIGAYKGSGTPMVADEPAKPDESAETYALITNHLFTSHFKDFSGLFDDGPEIDGSVLIGPDKLDNSYLTYGTNIKGNLYVYDNLIAVCGSPSYSTSVKGNLTVRGQTEIYPFLLGIFSRKFEIGGNFYHMGNTYGKNLYNVGLKEEQREVEIPNLNLPQLQSKKWHRDRGYSIINNHWDWHEWINSKNDKLYFNSDFQLNEDSYFDNNEVTIVAKKSLVIGENFKGSGVIFAPNGAVFFEPHSQFTGTVISEYLYLYHDVLIKSKGQTMLPY